MAGYDSGVQPDDWDEFIAKNFDDEYPFTWARFMWITVPILHPEHPEWKELVGHHLEMMRRLK